MTRVAKPEAVMAATFGVYGKTLTQIALGIHETTTLQIRKQNTRVKLHHELDYSSGS